MDLLLKKYDKVIWMGDSITDAGRRENNPHSGDLGYGYAAMATHLIQSALPDYGLVFKNFGVSGDTVLNFQQRWEADIIGQTPDVLSVLIGINDSWRIEYKSPREHTLMTPDHYEQNLHALYRQAVQACNCRLVLWEPFMITTDQHMHFYQRTQQYVERVHKLAREFNARVVPTQQAFNAALKQRSPEFWANDSVHPTRAGHALMARLFCKTIGLQLDA